MDSYIRDFEPTKVETFTLDSTFQTNEVLKINRNSQNFKLVHNNIRSMAKNLDEFKIFLTQFEFEFDCIVFTETRKIADCSVFNLPGYLLLYNEGNLNQNDGTIVYIKTEFYKHHEMIKFNGSVIIKLEIEFYRNQIVIHSFYRSPSTCIDSFNQNLHKYLETQMKIDKKINIFVGDININILNELNDKVSDYLTVLSEYGYISLINSPTHLNTCIDHIFIKTLDKNLENIIPIVNHTNITDHSTIIVQIVTGHNNGKYFERKMIPHFSREKFIANIKDKSWEEVYSDNTLDVITESFVSILQQEIEECTYYKPAKRSERKRKNWITTSLVRSVNKKNDLYKQLKKDPDNEHLKTEYKNYKKILDKLIKNTRNQYFQNEINKNKQNSGKLWENINEMFGGKQRVEIKSLKSENGKKIYDLNEIAKQFNNSYINTGKNLAKSIMPSTFTFTGDTQPNSIFLKPCTPKEVFNTINELKNHKAPGIDNLKSETLKLVAQHISQPISHIFNRSVETGDFPSCLKTSIVSPIYKSGCRDEVINYRPISLITNLSKIIEKLIKTRLNSFMQKYNILSKSQFGFREGMSTQNAVLELTNYVYGALDRSKPTLGVFIDLSKAFDTVNHSILLSTLENIGIRGNANKLLKSYLTDRKQMVRIQNEKSSEEIIQCGVPQGTVLGPILFCIYVNGLFSIGSAGRIISYADDTVILYSEDSWHKVKELAEKDLKLIKDWFDFMQLSLNFSKTYYLPFCNNKAGLPPFHQITVQNKYQIYPTTQLKYLGVVIDRHLRWDFHINYVVKKLRCVLYKFFQLKEILNFQQKKIIYYSLVQSHLIYCIIGWGGVRKTHLRPLEIIQRKFLKIMLNKPSLYPSDMLYEETQLLDIRQLFYKTLVLNQYKEIEKLRRPSHNHITRNRNIYLTPFAYKSIGQRSYHFLGPTVFNTLPEDVQSSVSYARLKFSLNDFMKKIPRKKIGEIFDRYN